jgi:hypothetical protein
VGGRSCDSRNTDWRAETGCLFFQLLFRRETFRGVPHLRRNGIYIEISSYKLPDFVVDYGFSQWLIIDVDFILGLLHYVDVDDVGDISKIHSASIFRVQVCRLVSFYVYSVILNYCRGFGDL